MFIIVSWFDIIEESVDLYRKNKSKTMNGLVRLG